MSRNSVTKVDLVPYLHKLKHRLYAEEHNYSVNERELAHRYLNYVLDRLEEYRQ